MNMQPGTVMTFEACGRPRGLGVGYATTIASRGEDVVLIDSNDQIIGVLPKWDFSHSFVLASGMSWKGSVAGIAHPHPDQYRILVQIGQPQRKVT